jgi:hypothetical protein
VKTWKSGARTTDKVYRAAQRFIRIRLHDHGWDTILDVKTERFIKADAEYGYIPANAINS